MEDKLLMIIEWLEGWRRTKGISDENVLSGDMLELFVGELQSKIVEVIEDFGPITDDYSGCRL